MAFKVWDGFDHYNNQNDLLSRSGFLQWQNPTTPLTISFVSGLTAGGAGKALQILGNARTTPAPDNVIRAVWGARNTEFYLGQRILVPGGNTNTPVSSFCLFFVDTTVGTNGTPQFTVYFNANNYSIQVFRGGFGGTPIGLSANNVWTGDASQFIEVHCKVDNSSGVVEVRVGNVVKLTVSGVDTQSTANAWCDAVDYSPFSLISGQNGWIAIDDLYYADTTTGAGTFAANTYAGDARVATLFATGNQSVSWTPLANTNWQEVSETAMDGDTSYNATAVAGNEDLLAFQALTGTIAEIFGLQITIAARKDDAGARTLEYTLKSGSAAEQYGSAWSVPDNYAYWTDAPIILDPNTGVNWTTIGINAAFYGYKLAS